MPHCRAAPGELTRTLVLSSYDADWRASSTIRYRASSSPPLPPPPPAPVLELQLFTDDRSSSFQPHLFSDLTTKPTHTEPELF